MKSIFSCKLYKCSPRQAKIQCALSNPVNAELVAQLAEYLDEEYQTSQYIGDAAHTGEGSEVADEIETSSAGAFDAESTSMPSHISPVSFTPSGSSFDALGDVELSDADEGDEGDDVELDAGAFDTSDIDDTGELDEAASNITEAAPSDDVASADKVAQLDKVTGESCTRDVITQDTIEQIRGMLNSRADTCNVNRVLLKDNELWIHYDDSINLNNVMGPVIELLNASGYTYLDFNRLARSANAVVFQISVTDSDRAIQPMEVTDNE